MRQTGKSIAANALLDDRYLVLEELARAGKHREFSELFWSWCRSGDISEAEFGIVLYVKWAAGFRAGAADCQPTQQAAVQFDAPAPALSRR